MIKSHPVKAFRALKNRLVTFECSVIRKILNTYSLKELEMLHSGSLSALIKDHLSREKNEENCRPETFGPGVKSDEMTGGKM